MSPYFHGRKKTEAFDGVSASNRLFKRYSIMVSILFIMGSVAPFSSTAEGMYIGDAGIYLDYVAYESGVVSDGEGYLTKFNPQTGSGDRSGMTGTYEHTVSSGETVSTIAEEYGLKTNTVLWANNMSNANSIRTGQKLLIPPVDGVAHKIAKGESLEKVAAKYSVESSAIEKQNGLIAANVGEGDEIFIPGGKPLYDESAARDTPARVGTSTRVSVGTPVALAGSTAAPVGDRPFIYPTRGGITQGYHAGHYAIDIADRSKPPVWAAGSGKVIKASSGTWGGGYGNHVIIDHGNGLQTLYAHMDYLSVGNGDIVDQGEVIGRMGRTGRVYGVTGIHLHFEVIKNGVKQLPSNYY